MGKFLSSLIWGLSGTVVSLMANWLNWQAPKTGFTVARNVAFGPERRHRCDIYQPAGKKDCPVMVFFYGGSWQYGRKEDYLFVGDAFAARGYTVVIADYRLYPDIRFPAFLDDGRLAVDWVIGHIAAYGGDLDRLFLCGHSAGAYIAVMLGANRHYFGYKDSPVKGVIGMAGVYLGLPQRDPNIKDLFRGADYDDLSLAGQLQNDWVPMLLATGRDDGLINPMESTNLALLATQAGQSCACKLYESTTHFSIILSLARYHQKIPLMDDIVRFTGRAGQDAVPEARRRAG